MSTTTMLACGDEFAQLFRHDNFIVIVAITFGCLIGMVGIVGSTLSTVLRTRAKEQTKRELAAYVAEGTLDADKAVEMLNAGMTKWARGDVPGWDKKA